MAQRASEAAKPSRGQPSIGVYVRMPGEVVAALERALLDAKSTRSDLIRRIVVEWLATHGHLPAQKAAPASRQRKP